MAIEVILKKPVEGLGAEADIVKVKSGFARNYLFPRDIAVVANAASKRQVEELKRKRAEREAQELNEAQELAGKLAKATLTFQMETSGEGDHAKVFGSVTAQDIVSRLAEQGYNIDKKKLGLAQPIKTLGETLLTLNLGHGVQAKLKVVLDAPQAAAEAKEAAEKKKGKGPRAKRVEKSDKEESSAS